MGGYLSLARGFDLAGMEARLQAIVRQARNSALYEGAPAGVFVEDVTLAELRAPPERMYGEVVAEKGETLSFLPAGRARQVEIPRNRLLKLERTRLVRSVGFQIVGCWHFEFQDSSAGYLGRNCSIKGGESVLGKFGGAILLEPGASPSKITALRSSDDAVDPFRLVSGGRIEMWVHALPASADAILCRREKSYELRLSADGTLSAAAGGKVLTAENYALPIGRWAKVAFTFSPVGMDITVDEVLRASGPGVELDPPAEGELVFGERFHGVIDEIKLHARIEGEFLELGTDFSLSAPSAVLFDSRGRLDTQVHSGPVRFELSRAGVSSGFSVSLGGLIE